VTTGNVDDVVPSTTVDPATPDVPASDVTDHPDELTENALRGEMGLPRRDLS
jgi:hypothetical protein